MSFFSSATVNLVILDLDGTIIDLFHHGAPSPRVRNAIRAVQMAGIPLTVGTGRTLDYIRENLGYLELQFPVITMHGAVIGDPHSGAIHREATIPRQVTRRLLRWLDQSSMLTVVYVNDHEGHTHLYQNRAVEDAADVAFHDHVFGAPRILQPNLSSLLTHADAHLPIKFICDNDPAHTPDLFPAVEQAFDGQLYLTRSHPRLLEGMALHVDKGVGLQALCAMLQIEPRHVLAIGDNDNDIPLLTSAGYAVAMGNATTGLKAVADWVAPPISEDGAAVVLEALLAATSS